MDEEKRRFYETGRDAALNQYPTETRQEAGKQAAKQCINENFSAAEKIPKNKPNSELTAEQHYQKLFAEKNKRYQESPSKQEILSSGNGRHKLEAIDHDIGKQMIREGRNEKEVANTFNKCSPRAASLEHTHGKQEKAAYCHNAAKLCDAKVQTQNKRSENSNFQVAEAYSHQMIAIQKKAEQSQSR